MRVFVPFLLWLGLAIMAGALIALSIVSVFNLGSNGPPMADTFSSYVEAINEGHYVEALELVDGDCLDNLASIAPPEGAIEWEVLMAAKGDDAGMIAFQDNFTEGTGWQLMTKVDGNWKVACEIPWE